MKKLYLFGLLLLGLPLMLSAQQNGQIDAPGDILIIGFKDAALNPGDGFSFLAVDDIPAGTELIFTEDEWNGSAFEGTEGEVVWTNTTGSTIVRGSVITIENADDTGGTISASQGTAVEVGSFSLAPPEHIYVIIGSRMSPTFISFFSTSTETANGNTLTGTGLNLGSTAIALGESPTLGTDATFIYDGPTSCSGTLMDCLDQIYNTSNWTDMETFPADVPPSFSGSVLPIELVSFSAKLQENKVLLKWNTLTETNNAYMAVEHSLNGEQFQEIGRVKGAGTTTAPRQYSYVHPFPAQGPNYYRLRQVDLDGAATYHKVVVIVVKENKNAPALALWPNPVSDQTQLLLLGSQTETEWIDLNVFDQQGRLLLHQQHAAQEMPIQLQVEQLPAGVYTVQLQSGSLRLSEQLIKQ